MKQKFTVYSSFSLIPIFCLISLSSLSQIRGKVFKDINSNGIQETSEQGMPYVRVTLFNHLNEMVSSDYSDSEGKFDFPILDGQTYRIEFDNLPQSYYTSPVNKHNGGAIQFVTSPSNHICYAVSSPDNFSGGKPRFVVPFFQLGKITERKKNTETGLALIDADSVRFLSTFSHIGSIWGMAYDRINKRFFSTAFAKRFAGYGELGPSGIYVTTLEGQPKPFVKLEDYGFSAGNDSHVGLSEDSEQRLTDPILFKEVGKVSFGGVDIDQNGENLYVMNLNDRSLYTIKIDTEGKTNASAIRTFTFPKNACKGGEIRPFAVKIYQNQVYVGSVCDASNSKKKEDLSATVWKLDTKKDHFDKIVTIPLTYERKGAGANYEAGFWYPWNDNPDEVISKTAPELFLHPQPILSKIEFDNNGAMILAFMDRLGHQHADNQIDPNGKMANTSIMTSGDILRLEKRDNGNYQLEKNGQVANLRSSGISNQEGPNGGEFYAHDSWEWKGQYIQSETGEGSVAISPINNQVIYATHQLQNNINYTHGLKWFSNIDGSLRRTTTLWQFKGSAIAKPSLINANALGDIEIIDDAIPFGVGGRIWNDNNKNGIQDANEPALSNVKVLLYDGDSHIASTVTQSNGIYTFLNTDTERELKLRTTYRIVVPSNQNGIHYSPTALDQGNNDMIDSDGQYKNEGIETSVNTNTTRIINYSTGIGLLCNEKPDGIAWKTQFLNGSVHLIPDKWNKEWHYDIVYNAYYSNIKDYSDLISLPQRPIMVKNSETVVYTIRVVSPGGCYSDYTFHSLEKNLESDRKDVLILSPNPAEDEVTYQLKGLISNRPLKLTITDLSGRILWQHSLIPRDGNITGTNSIKHFSTGSYVFQVTDGQHVYTVKFSKK